MDFKDQIKQLSERVVKLKDNIQTEEATKTAFIMPMIQALGYDVFDPTEVVPEFTCDLGIKKGEKIDDISRVVHRDTQSYFGILLDDNNRKPICRLHFNTGNKYLETFDAEKNGTKHLLESLDDIYKYRTEIVAACKMY